MESSLEKKINEARRISEARRIQEEYSGRMRRQREKYAEITAKLKKGEVQVHVLSESALLPFSRAALATGFKVELIADEGEYCSVEGPFNPRPSDRIKEGCIVVSIEKPEGSRESTDSRDFAPFWDMLRSLRQKKSQPPSNPTTKSTAKP